MDRMTAMGRPWTAPYLAPWKGYAIIYSQQGNMAWFDPPLYKPGNHKCPNCGHPQGWNCYFQSRRWGPLGSWRCSKCQSALRLDGWRYLLGFLGPVIAVLTFLVFALTMPVWPSWLVFVVVLALVVFGGFNYWWSLSVRLKGTPEQPQSSQPNKPSVQ